MKKKEYLSLGRLSEQLMLIEDPRRSGGNLQHRLVDVLIIVLMGFICGCDSWEDIEDYGRTKEAWLKGFLPLENGIPSADTYRRLFERIEPSALERAYREWVEPYVGSCLHKQIGIDGKSVRGAGTMGSNLHMVSAWIREDGVTLGQIRTEEKSNEITAIPELLGGLDVHGGIVTIDAMGCQRAIAQCILKKEADYVLAVKLNQPTLYEDIREYFTWAVGDRIEAHNLSQYEAIEKEHGRISTWTVTATKDVAWMESKGDWAGLNSLIMVERKVIKGDEQSRETQYYISSLLAPAAKFHHLIRNHWSIENQLHWVLDATFNEDKALIHKDHSPQNLSVIRKIALALIKKDSSKKASLRRKQNIAGWDDAFLASLFL